MNKLYTLLVAIMFTASAFAQAPQKMSYQAVVRSSNNEVVANQMVGMKVSILQGAISGGSVYTEIQNPTSNINGLVTIEVGTGNVVIGLLGSIDWSTGPFYIKTEIDPTGGSNYSITGTSQLMSVPFALHANTADSIVGDVKYSIGDLVQGGIVFWVDQTGKHGLVCTKTDEQNLKWFAGTYGNTQAKGDGIFAGKLNTSIIIASQVAIGDDGSLYAARYCNELQVTEDGKNYGDWYLPSKKELNEIYLNKDVIDAVALANGGLDLFSSSHYLSSTEMDDRTVWLQYFSNGIPFTFDKSIEFAVRPIRAF